MRPSELPSRPDEEIICAPARDFLEVLSSSPLVFDGATGTMLYERGVYLNKCFDAVCLDSPALVEDVQREYVDVGVDVLQTNTYGTHPIALAKHGLADKVRDICIAAVGIAQRAAAGRCFVAGSVGPSTLLPKDLIRSRTRRGAFEGFMEQITALHDAGVDLLVFETFHYLGELEIAVEASYNCNLPVVAQVSLEEDGLTKDGATSQEVGARLEALGVDVIGANCVLGPEGLMQNLDGLLESGLPVILQPNAGHAKNVDGRALYQSSPETFGVVARRAFKKGVRAFGGCCGTSPEHLRRVVGAARMMGGGRWRNESDESGGEGNVSSRIQMLGAPTALQEMAERSSFGAKLARGEFVTSIELSPPLGLNAAAALEKIRSLEGICDVVNIPDGPRATVRMSNIAFAKLVLDETKMEPLVHFCGRDRNLLGLQSDLLGAHVLGVRNLVVVTGDPPKVGDYPDATAVFDLDSPGMLAMASGLNAGVDPVGKVLPEAGAEANAHTSFVIATGAEPAALNFKREVERLEEKAEAGAEIVMTQPVFDVAILDRFLEATAHLKLRVLVGILPLASSKNAEFLHQNVPGMRIPDAVRKRMFAAGSSREAQEEEGIAIASDALALLRDRVQGAYFMPPFGRTQMATAIIKRVL
ncbi:MAG: bifunctional homocysteine S-methyltransferase/methylenetetrahydrofolate reductase [Deltaproteobacteria bacterium]|nr:bifunctional homocysteine S-methyltransferase/methylenetetrahydrofolate reductase [Deltaproteobacteria bacterium]